MKEVTPTGVHEIGSSLRATAGVVTTSGYPDAGSTSVPIGNVPGNQSTLWPQPMPYIPNPSTTWITTTKQSPTFEERAELVLALLLGGIDDEDSVLIREATDREADDNDAAAVAFVNDPSCEGTLVLISKENTFHEIVDALYAQLTNLRGRQLR